MVVELKNKNLLSSPFSKGTQEKNNNVIYERLYSEHTERAKRLRELSQNYYKSEMAAPQSKKKLSQLKSARESISRNPDTTLSDVDSSHHKVGRECRDETI